MTKTCAFNFYSVPIEIKLGMMFLVIDIRNGAQRTFVNCTWAEAKERFAEFAAQTPAPRACFMSCNSTPKPPGWYKAEKTISRKGEDDDGKHGDY